MISVLLKEETKQLHAETEKSLNAKRIFSDDFTAEEYKGILSILYSAHFILENRLEKISDPTLSEFYRKYYQPHYPLIKKDLDHLDAEVINDKSKSGLDISDLNCLGVIYVLKGSSMGAKYINKQLEKTTAQWSSFSGEFYKYSASQTMEEWKAFCTSLDTLNLSSEETEEVVEGAREAFRTFILGSKTIT